eukprot:3057516-Rhodomonas_salina.1
MPRYPDKSWKQNQLNKLECADSETKISRAIYDRWQGHSSGVFKAMKIPFVPKLADSLSYNNGLFASLIPGVADDPTNAAFRKRVVSLVLTEGFQFADKDDNDATKAISDDSFQRNYDEITDILDD